MKSQISKTKKSLSPVRFGLIIQRGIQGNRTRISSAHPMTGFVWRFNWGSIIIQSRVTSHCLLRKWLLRKEEEKLALKSHFYKITGYLRPTSLSDATFMVPNILDQVIEGWDEPQLIVQTIVNDMLHKIGTETESTTTKHASD